LKIVIAPDSYKGCASAITVARAIRDGIVKVFPNADISMVPIADGGEGTVEALVTATQGKVLSAKVRGPLGDQIVCADWGILGDGRTAVIEMAAASGLPLIPQGLRNPLLTTTFGTGQLIVEALNHGLRNIIIGLGGSATNDGGQGMARALGIRFLNQEGLEIPEGGGGLSELAAIDLTGIDPRIDETRILVACDVDNPLCGPNGASAIYGPQKGATHQMVHQLDSALRNYSKVARVSTGRDVADIPGAGAAGGLGAGLLFFTNAKLQPGVQIVLEATDFDSLAQTADLIITGEGMTDEQTTHGKAPVGVASVGKKYKKPVLCISGSLGNNYQEVLRHGIDVVMPIVPGPINLEQAMSLGLMLIEEAAERGALLMKIGMHLTNP
jgi:glycerate kinase